MSEVFADEQSVFFVGGRGDKSGRLADAGGCTKVWWDAEVAANGEAAAMAKLMTNTGAPIVSDTGAAYTLADDKISAIGVFRDVEVGMVVYVIETPTPDTNVETGRYKITDVDPSGDWIECDGIDGGGDASVDIEIGGAFDELNNAVDETSAITHSVALYTNLDETLTTAISITAGGSNTRNTFKRILGFNTVPSDMDRGGMYYESPFDMLLNGTINNDRTVVLDANNGAFEPLSVSADNIAIENVHLYNTNNKNAILFTGTPQNIVFRNCRFSDLAFVYSTVADSVLADSCFATSLSNNHYQMSGDHNVIWNCVSEVAASKMFGVVATVEGSQMIGCLAIGGARGIRVFGRGITAFNNTFYNQTSFGMDLTNAETAIVFNNIFALYPGAIAFTVSTPGSYIYNDYNCFIESDGTPLTVGSHGTGYEVPVIGSHSITVDPMFVDAANGNFRPANDSPCIDAGVPDSLGGWSTMGAYDLSANRGLSKSRVIGGV